MKTIVVKLLPRCIVAAISGFLVFLSYEPRGWYPMGIIGILLLIMALSPTWPAPFRKLCADTSNCSINLKEGFLIGLIHGLTLYALLLPWVGEFVGPAPFLILALYLSLWSGLLGLLGAKVLQHKWGVLGFAFIYVTIEWARSTFPFGGFAWVRLAWGQVEGPLAALVALGGPALVTLGVVLLGSSIWGLLIAQSRKISAVTLILTLLCVTGASVLLTKRNAGTGSDSLTVAAVQGNVPRMGLDFASQRQAVLNNHVNATAEITEPVDVIFWPENSSDVNPLTNSDAAAGIAYAAKKAHAPIVLGTITYDSAGDRNTVIVFDPKTGWGEFHYKKFLQPFGEYMPFRNILRAFFPLVDRAGDFKPGTGDGVVSVRRADTDAFIKVGISTCYEIAFDESGRSAIRNGATIMASPTNNATFGFTTMTYQQLAMTRMRAIELDRSFVVPATSGVSALVSPTGEILQHSEIFERAVLSGELPLRETITPAVRLGRWVEYALVIIGFLCVVKLLGVPHRKSYAVMNLPNTSYSFKNQH